MSKEGSALKGQIKLAHGSGGSAMSGLIADLFHTHFSNPVLLQQSDSAVVDLQGSQVAMTTDSYVVDPLFFPGGDIGKLSVCGTLNDLAVSGARPQYLSVSFIIEEGFQLELLEKIVISMAAEAGAAGVPIVTGDTKVVNHGKCDKLFITTTGIGTVPAEFAHIHNASRVCRGDRILINGSVADHGIAVLLAREKFSFTSSLKSDCRNLYPLISAVLNRYPGISFMRDATRGGIAAVLNELSCKTGFGIILDEKHIPVKNESRAIAELLGMDPLHIANEGKVVMTVPQEISSDVLDLLRSCEGGEEAAIIGEISSETDRVILETISGGSRIVDHISGEQLPRIC